MLEHNLITHRYTDIPSGYIPAYEFLKRTLANRHQPTAEHSIKVRIYALNLGLQSRLESKELTELITAAELHDIGKLYFKESILDKPGKLTHSEWQQVKFHPILGYQLLIKAFPNNPEIAKAVLEHHERMDSSGYPYGIGEKDLSLNSRIIAVADAFVALTDDRSYRKAYSILEAIKILSRDEKSKYDQDLVELLVCSVLKEESTYLGSNLPYA